MAAVSDSLWGERAPHRAKRLLKSCAAYGWSLKRTGKHTTHGTCRPKAKVTSPMPFALSSYWGTHLYLPKAVVELSKPKQRLRKPQQK